jgi:hypothetical protein
LTNSSLAIRSSPPYRVFCRHPADQTTQFGRNRWSARPALPAPENPPAQSVPANDGCRLHVDHRVAPIEESGEQCEVDASRVIHTSGLDTTLDTPRELFAKNQILSADSAGRSQERNTQPQDVKGYPDGCSRPLQHPLIMPESARVWRRRTLKCLRRELLRTTASAMRAHADLEDASRIPYYLMLDLERTG